MGQLLFPDGSHQAINVSSSCEVCLANPDVLAFPLYISTMLFLGLPAATLHSSVKLLNVIPLYVSDTKFLLAVILGVITTVAVV